MNKTELVAAVAEKAGLSKKDAEAATKAVFDAVTEALKKGDKVQLIGFGTFDVRERAEKEQAKRSRSQPARFPASRRALLSKTQLNKTLYMTPSEGLAHQAHKRTKQETKDYISQPH